MRKTLLFFFLLIITWPIKAQWTPVIDQPNTTIQQIVFYDDLHGYVLGYGMTGQSFIYRTTDGGTSWDTVHLATPYLSYLHMTGAYKGYLFKAGSPNQMVRTVDGFSSFIPVSGPMDSCFSYFGMATINDSTGFTLLNEGRLHRFQNYGGPVTAVWNDLTLFTSLSFPSNDTGYVVGGYDIRRSSDAGATWYDLAPLPFNTIDAKFTTSLTGYFLAYDNVYDRSLRKTINGGGTFTLLNNFKASTFTVRNDFCFQVDSAGNVALSNNGGNTWTYENTGAIGSGADIYSLAITPSGGAWLGNSSGQLYKRSGSLNIQNTIDPLLSVQVFPNPASEKVNIVLAENGNHTCKLYDRLGKCLLTESFTGNEHTLLLGTITTGVYFLNIRNEKTSITTKLVKH